ncbi:hypothetical protein ACIPSA_27095 [Streptomyces sp. NPDC086549]|uniref:hypothetical protein n=1 Tax=Streptomyces sp. NPDC086549 TaxID=3365752 RepID=UPI00380D1990
MRGQDWARQPQKRRLAQTGLHEFEPGLSDAEFARIQRGYGFEFADDHRDPVLSGCRSRRRRVPHRTARAL